MPVKLRSKLRAEGHEARIEIVPLIDIMFFLLASFMLVSLSMVNLKSVKLNLPTASTAVPETSRKDLFEISVDSTGGAYVDQKPITDHELVSDLTSARQTTPDLKVVISGDRDAHHGKIIHVLDLIRAAGIDKVALEAKSPDGASH